MSPAPDWFTRYVSISPQSARTLVDNVDIHYLHWQNPGKPGLVFVHGHAAHAHWWDFIAPAFKDSHDIVAIDLSGAGDSGHRDLYTAAGFAKEIVSVADAAGLHQPCVVGHSFGGSMTRIAAHLHPDKLGSIVLVDSALPTTRSSRDTPAMPRTRVRHYPSIPEGMRRFRLRPPQPATHDYIIEHIAKHSLTEAAEGFRFKLDQAVFAKMTEKADFPTAAQMVRDLTIPASFIYGEKSRFFPAPAVDGLKALFAPASLAGIPNAYHHVFLDEPLAFIEALRALIGPITD